MKVRSRLKLYLHLKIKTVLCVLIFFSCSSCSSLKTPERSDFIALSAPGVVGQYPVDKTNFVFRNYLSNPDSDTALLSSATHFHLQLNNNKSASVTLYNNKQVLLQRDLKGKLKDGYFRLKHRLRWSGIPILLWSINSEKMQFGQGSEQQLYIDQASSRSGAFLFFLAGTPDITFSTTIPTFKPR